MKEKIKSIITAGLIFAALAGGIKSCKSRINEYEKKSATQQAVLDSLDLKDKLELHRRIQDGYKCDELFADMVLSNKLKSFEEEYKKDADNRYWLQKDWHTLRNTCKVQWKGEWERITNVAEGRYNYCGKDYIMFETYERGEVKCDSKGCLQRHEITDIKFYDIVEDRTYGALDVFNANESVKLIRAEQKRLDSLMSIEQKKYDSLKSKTKLEEKINHTYLHFVKG